MRLSTICTTGLRVGLALAAVAAVPALVAEGPAATPAAVPSIFSMDTSVTAPTRDVRYQPEGVSSSSSIDDTIAAGDPSSALDTERDSLSLDAGQPPPGRRSYGRSRYQDRWHNSDGSSKIAFMAGGGMTTPVGNTAKFYTPSWNIAAGAGINFNRMFGVLGEFHYDHMGLTGGAIDTEYTNLYNYLADNGYDPSQLQGFDANAHVISFTVDPVINLSPRQSRMGAYVTGGGGWYRKTTNFTLPDAQTGCNEFYCQTFYTTYNVDQASADTFGWNLGGGLTYKLSNFSSERLFAEARYNWLPISSNNNQDFFPYNRRHTEYIPFTVGIRF